MKITIEKLVMKISIILAVILLMGCNSAQPEIQSVAASTLPTTTIIPPTKTLTKDIESTINPSTNTPTPTPDTYDAIPEQVKDGWETDSLISVDINPIIINDMLTRIYRGEYSDDSVFNEDGSLKYEGIHSIIIVKEDKLVFEEYFNLNSREFTHDTHSVTKSITSLLIGLAIEHGYLSGIDEKVFPYFTDYQYIPNWDENKASITIRDLLTMSSGLDCDDSDPLSMGQQWKMYPSENWLEFFLELPSVRSPSKLFAYCSGGVVALGGVLQRTTSMSISDFSEQYLFSPMGIHDFSWLEFGWGTSTSGALWLRPRDMAKIGQLMLKNGRWGGNQIVQESWVRSSRAKQIDLKFGARQWFNEYGYLWWRGDLEIQGGKFNPYAAWGLGGQLILVFPKEDMVVVFTTGNEDSNGNIPLRIIEKYILPAVLEGASN